MKIFAIFISILLVISFTFGQTKRVAPKPSPKPVPATEVKPQLAAPTQKVTVLKTNGDKISGLLVSATTEALTVDFSGSTITIKLTDISSINLNEPVVAAAPVSQPSPAPSPVKPDQTTSTTAAAPPAQEDIFAGNRPKVVATLEDVTLFPDNYNDKLVNFNGVWSGKIHKQSDGSDTAYILSVESQRGASSAIMISRDEVIFLLRPDIAQALAKYYQQNNTGEYTRIAANIETVVKRTNYNNTNYTIAGVKCISIINTRGGISQKIGVCN